MVSRGVVPSVGPGGATAVSGSGAAGITIGSRARGAGGGCAHPPAKYRAPVRKRLRVARLIRLFPLAELILPGTQHAEHLGHTFERSTCVDLGGPDDSGVIAA